MYHFSSVKSTTNHDVGILTKMNIDGGIAWTSIALIEYINDGSNATFQILEKDFEDIHRAINALYKIS